MNRAVTFIGAVVFSGITTAASLLFAESSATNPATEQATILVLPFSAPSDAGRGWMGKAVQQDLLTDLSQGTQARVLAPATVPPAADADSARQAAQKSAASIVVFGQIQQAAAEMRLTGQVVEVATGKPLANLKATGSADSLFRLEDALAGQTLAALPRGLLSAQALQPPRTPEAPAGQNPSIGSYAPANQQEPYAASAPGGYYAPEPNYAYPATNNYYYSSNYYPPVPLYTYPYPAFDLFPFASAFVFIDIDHFHRFHDHFFDHDFDHDGDIDHFRGHGSRNFGGMQRGDQITRGLQMNRMPAGVGRMPGARFGSAPSMARPRFAPSGFSHGGGMHLGNGRGR